MSHDSMAFCQSIIKFWAPGVKYVLHEYIKKNQSVLMIILITNARDMIIRHVCALNEYKRRKYSFLMVQTII